MYNFQSWLLFLSRYLVSVYSDASVPYPYGTNSVVVHLDLGDIVYVMAHPAFNNSLYGNSYGTFSGFLVKAGNCTSGMRKNTLISAACRISYG